MSGRTSSGSFGSGRTAGYAIGEGRTSPWLEAIAGIRERPYPRLDSKPLPAPRTRRRYGAVFGTDFQQCPRLKQKHPFRAPPRNVVRVNPFLARLHYVACMTVCIYCMYRYRRRPRAPLGEAAAQLSSNSLWPALRDCATRESVPGQTCRTPRGGLEDEIVHVRLDVDNPEARQHYGIGTANTSVAAAKSCCTGHHRRPATSARR